MQLPREYTTGRRLEITYLVQDEPGIVGERTLDVVFESTENRDIVGDFAAVHPWAISRVASEFYHQGMRDALTMRDKQQGKFRGALAFTAVGLFMLLASAVGGLIVGWILG